MNADPAASQGTTIESVLQAATIERLATSNQSRDPVSPHVSASGTEISSPWGGAVLLAPPGQMGFCGFVLRLHSSLYPSCPAELVLAIGDKPVVTWLWCLA